jgi:transcription antitermination factor NusG
MPRHEKRIAALLEQNNVCAFLPLLQQLRRWTDRNSNVEVPLFDCYIFVRILSTSEERLRVLRTPGVWGFVGSERQGTPIPQEQIESLRTFQRENLLWSPHAFLTAGKRVRIRGGSLDGIEGIIVRKGSAQSLVVSVDLLQRSVSIQVDGYRVESI